MKLFSTKERNHKIQKFIPVKITDRKWAERLLDGEVFMRPLHDFGCWNEERDEAVSNDYRGDLYEGATAVFGDTKQFPGIEGFSSDFQKVVRQISVIDNGDLQYFKIFSLYRMIYNSETDFFEKPDPRMKQFGDTAVIIRDYNTFIARYGKALFSRYKMVCSMISPVDFYQLCQTKLIIPLFSKEKSYEYQNGLRMAFCELTNDMFSIGLDNEHGTIIQDLSPVTLQIGDIRDIALALPINDFLELKFPRDISLRFPMNDSLDKPTNYDLIVNDTKKQMEEYHPIYTNLMAII